MATAVLPMSAYKREILVMFILHEPHMRLMARDDRTEVVVPRRLFASLRPCPDSGVR